MEKRSGVPALVRRGKKRERGNVRSGPGPEWGGPGAARAWARPRPRRIHFWPRDDMLAEVPVSLARKEGNFGVTE